MNDAIAKRTAKKICETWQVGTSSRFCDDAPDWDDAATEDVAAIIASEYADVIAERDRLAKQVERLKSFLAPDNVRKWWRFDDHQQPFSSWHERETFIERIDAALQEQPNA